jgi:hypothetical protein
MCLVQDFSLIKIIYIYKLIWMEGIKSLYYSTKSDMFRTKKFICSRHKPKYLHNLTLTWEIKSLNLNILFYKSKLL